MKKKKKNKSLKSKKLNEQEQNTTNDQYENTNSNDDNLNNDNSNVESTFSSNSDNIIELNLEFNNQQEDNKFKSEDDEFQITKFKYPEEEKDTELEKQKDSEDFLEELNEFHDKYLEPDNKENNDDKSEKKDNSTEAIKNVEESFAKEEPDYLKNIKIIPDDLIENLSEENEDGFLFYKMDDVNRSSWWKKQKDKYKKSKFHKILKQISLKNKLAGFIFVLILSILIIFSIYYISPLSYISKVNVRGNYIVSKEDIIQTTGLKKDTRFWDDYFNQKALLQKVKNKYPSVKNLTLSIHHFNQVNINVEEYSWDGMLKVNDYYYPVLNNGIILKIKYTENEGNRLVFSNFNSEKLLQEVIKQYESLSENIQNKIKEIEYHPTKSNDLEMKLYMKDGNIVMIEGNNFNNLKYYNKVAKQLKEKSIIDMEVGIFARPIDSSANKNNQNNLIQQDAQSQQVVIPTN